MNGILVIDIGTSSVRAIVRGTDGSVLASVSQQRDAGICFDAELEWERIRKMIASVSTGYSISAIAVSALLGWVGVDHAGNALTPCYTYMHKESRIYDRMREQLSDDQVYQICRRKAAAEQLAYKMYRLRTEKQELYAEISCFLSLKDFINRKLTEANAIDHTTASYTLLYNVAEQKWSGSCLEWFAIDRDKLPDLKRSDEVLATVKKELCPKLGLSPDCCVAVGSVDGSTGVFGVGGTQEGALVSIMGTTETCFSIQGFLPEDRSESLVVNPHVIPGYYLIGGPTGLSGGTLDWLTGKVLCGVCTLQEMNEKAAQVPCGSDGVIMLPALEGDRTPFWEEQMCGTMFGLKRKHGSEHIFRAAMEANGYTHRRIAEIIRDTGAELNRVIATGGGARSDLWLQIKADILKMEVLRSDIREATSEGSWKLAMLALGEDPERNDSPSGGNGIEHSQCCASPQEATCFSVGEKQAEEYDRLYQNFLNIYQKAAKLYREM